MLDYRNLELQTRLNPVEITTHINMSLSSTGHGQQALLDHIGNLRGLESK